MITYGELYEQARILKIKNRSKMTKIELYDAIQKCIRMLKKKKIYVKTCAKTT